ncbi:cob(I)yrinic acid a,c-diamide adenosyltransferase [Sphingobacteriales bacterium UPWRP_1]|nr:ATP:cob(I)alamin adenosyltransferase [Sphingobacteriales bacterium TSM_CSM]PSJ76192.1 cob(I)yrinic acid a,c-diamide adenosyltransferase [Sphingobacteriales bacterium UPWRP_1]
MKIYTKTGDDGSTMLFGGGRVPKSHIRIETYGTVDELNAHIGLVRDVCQNPQHSHFLEEVQNTLFVLGANLATNPQKSKVQPPALYTTDVETLEQEIDRLDATLPPLKNFVLPGGHSAVSYCHIARCVCRRAERLAVLLNAHEPVDALLLQYLNRLSDYLFVLSRKLSAELNAEELIWNPRNA